MISVNGVTVSFGGYNLFDNISFLINPKDRIGLAGKNGAGKSTLLKMITGTTQPTVGRVHTTGRVAALLELGMGFHPDFTGRQNAMMAGQLLGLSAGELERLMPEIISFAEIGDYIEQPVRVYSSGMQMRLAFSVACAKRPDILIVDEALSVGDTYFQHKSFERIRSFCRQGTTLLMVSHDKGAVQGICDRAILLDAGRLSMQGAPDAVMDYYNALLAERDVSTVRQQQTDQGQVQTASGSGEARIDDVYLLDEGSGARLESVNVGQTITLVVDAHIEKDLPEVVLGYAIKDRWGQTIYGTNTHHLRAPLKELKAGETLQYRFRFPANLGAGSYSMSIALHTADTHIAKNFEWRDLAMVFEVINADKDNFVGLAWLPPEMECRR